MSRLILCICFVIVIVGCAESPNKLDEVPTHHVQSMSGDLAVILTREANLLINQFGSSDAVNQMAILLDVDSVDRTQLIERLAAEKSVLSSTNFVRIDTPKNESDIDIIVSSAIASRDHDEIRMRVIWGVRKGYDVEYTRGHDKSRPYSRNVTGFL